MPGRLANWKSYEPVEFTMVATKERRHGDRLARVGRSRGLPVTAVYGANAAGKSTLVDGPEALREIILTARRPGAPLPVTPRLLKGAGEPTAFSVEFIAPSPDGGEDLLFLYELTVDRRKVHRESLVHVRPKTEELLFERTGNEVVLYRELDADERSRAHATVVAPNETLLGALGEEGTTMVAAARNWFALPLKDESDGTQRFVNLLPMLFQLSAKDSRNVFIVDEPENSMHPKLTEDFIASFLEDLGPDDRRQLIFTTHEIQLMRADLLRRDEIWLADKVGAVRSYQGL